MRMRQLSSSFTARQGGGRPRPHAAGRPSRVADLCSIFVPRESFEREWAADHVTAQSGSTLPVFDPHRTVDREAAVAPGQKVADGLLADETLVHERPQDLGAEEAFEVSVVEAFLGAWAIGPYREADEIDPAVLRQLRRMGTSPIRVQLGGDPSGELSPPSIGRLTEVRAPTLAILGDLDMPSIHEILGRVRDEVSGAELVTFAGAAHMVNLEQPDRFLETVLEFLEKVDEASGEGGDPPR